MPAHDGGAAQPLHESGTICEYLDEAWPDPPLPISQRCRS